MTGLAAAGWVEYGPEGSTATTVVPVRDGLVDANTRVHRVDLSGLAPDAAYSYRVVTRPIVSFGPYKVDYGDIVRSETHVFRTPGPARPSYSFLVLNDLHEDVEIMRAQLARAAAEPYDLVFFNGDPLSHLETERQVLDDALGRRPNCSRRARRCSWCGATTRRAGASRGNFEDTSRFLTAASSTASITARCTSS